MPAPTQRQILEGRRGIIPPVPTYADAADQKAAPATAEQVERRRKRLAARGEG